MTGYHMEKVTPIIPEVVYQNEISECGLACIAMALQHLENAPTLYELREKFPVSLFGASMADLIDIITSYGLEATPVQYDVNQLNKLPTPAILHFNKNHFIYLAYCKGNYAYVIDPAMGPRLIPIGILQQYLSPFAILCQTPTTKKQITSKKWLPSIIDFSKKTDKKLLFISLLAGCGAFFIPMFISISLDKIMPNSGNDGGAIWSLAFVFLLAILSTSLIDYFSKKLLVNRILAESCMELSATYFKLLQNTLHFFERRETGDIASRYSAYERSLLQNISINNQRAVSSIVLFVSIIAMLLVNPLLTLLACLTIIIYGIASVFYKNQRVILTQEFERANASKTEWLYESIRGITTIKTAVLLPLFSKKFSLKLERVLTVWRKNSLNESQQQVIYTIIASVELIFMISIALPLLATNALTFGEFYAFTFFRQIALSSATTFFFSQIQRKECDVAVTRAQDMIFATKDRTAQPKQDFETTIYLKELNYRYDRLPVLININLTLSPGKKIAIVGTSGSGKSTLLKIIAGLITPQEGNLISEKTTHENIHWEWLAQRSFITTQDDILLHTSMLENVRLFDKTITSHQCLQQLNALGLSSLIENLPNKLNTIVSENNSPLSVGQRQRVMIARALIQSKPIMLLDEPTANLDANSAAMAMNAILTNPKTAIVVTHENKHLEQFDEVYSMSEGHLTQIQLQQVA